MSDTALDWALEQLSAAISIDAVEDYERCSPEIGFMTAKEELNALRMDLDEADAWAEYWQREAESAKKCVKWFDESKKSMPKCVWF